MQINVRGKKLERSAGVVGGCPACKGADLGRFVMVVNGIEQVPIEPVGCPRCGKGRVWKQIMMELPGDEFINERRRLRVLGGYRDPEAAGATEAVPCG